MTESAMTALCHFALARFTPAYWALSGDERKQLHARWLCGLRQCATQVDIYQVFPASDSNDVCVWSSIESTGPEVAAQFFESFARASNPVRRYVEFPTVLWGYAKRSQYSSATRSAQALDPFSTQRCRYLVIYPFVKTTDWYLKSRDERQALMNDHMRIGKQYPEISQLLLYSFGLQDQEFVPVYAMDSLERFSELVAALRGSEGRRYTLRDTPLHTCVWHQAEMALGLF